MDIYLILNELGKEQEMLQKLGRKCDLSILLTLTV